MGGRRYNKHIDVKVDDLPWYVQEFVEKRKRKLSPATLLNYCFDYILFFNWLVNEGYWIGNKKDISLEFLETLTTQQMEDFITFLEIQQENSRSSVNRKLSSLKSLFNYLQNVAETNDLKPYIIRNVMARVDLNDIKEDQMTIADRINGKILRDDEFENFRQFVSDDYGKLNINNKKLYFFHLVNKERDTAIISLILGSGLRLSEVVGADIGDLDVKNSCIKVMRKGNKEQYVYFSEQALLDLKEYLLIRDDRYKLKNEKPLFIAAQVGPANKSRRLTPRSVEKLVEKYAKQFGKPALSVHTLRHSFATRYHQENNDVPKLRIQLGHASAQTTMIYTHLTNTELKDAVNKV
ncbi:tyrosine recombinase XerS [Paenibacillus sedimenti]|uniref:Tyrosine recombinase XerS n=1 Tax=Paenibacillus sedimenti TaxID=2770274 RepID=A0A926KZ97_9BACL|nr:tyrosine recombinase XerS [Paenibacillus sedimenti]MBD0384854.1 tyrosine recombinase XerS [Paenibacillus sedimenti]